MKNYKEFNEEDFKKEVSKFFKDEKIPGFTKPLGQIGNSGMYRISDNCVTGKGGWELFCEEFKKQYNIMYDICTNKIEELLKQEIDGK